MIETKKNARFRIQVTDIKLDKSKVFTIYTDEGWSLEQFIKILQERMKVSK